MQNLRDNGMSGLTSRMHSKILTTSDGDLITGGRNWEDPYFGIRNSGGRIIDMDVYVNGPAAGEARQYQEMLWNSKHVQELPGGNLNPARRKEIKATLDRFENYFQETGFLRLQKQTDWKTKARPVRSAEFVWDHHFPDGKPTGSGEAILDLLRGAKEEVLWESQYGLPPDELLQELMRTTKTAKVRLLVNGWDANFEQEDWITRPAYELKRKKLLLSGVEIKEASGNKIHSKQMVVDRERSLISSINLDPLSWNTNLEAGVLIEDPTFASLVHERIESRFSIANVSLRNGKPLRQEKCVTLFKKLILSLPAVQRHL
jgi:phosphatidylserine/phosphatidylglycerophosphate/cardiolipin synthase-like enzyme